MKKIKVVVLSAVVVALTASASLYAGSRNEKVSDAVIENAAALESMAASRAECYSQYEKSDAHRVLQCILCTYADGKGEDPGGYCRVAEIKADVDVDIEL